MALDNIPTLGPGGFNGNLDKVLVYKNGGSEVACSLLTLTNSALNPAGLYLDPVNQRVGIGTTTPGAALEIYGGVDTLGISGPANQAKSIQIARYNNSSFQSHYIGDDGGAFFGSGLTISASGSNSQLYLQVASSGRNVNIGTAGQTLLSKDMGARLGVRGSGSTSATTSLLVQNSSGVTGLTVFDNGNVSVGSATNSFYQLYGNGAWFNLGSIYTPVLYTSNIVPASGGSTNFYANLNNFKIGTSATATGSAVFEVDSTTQGFLPPRLTTAQKNLIASPAAGLMVYDTDLNRPCFHNGSAWVTL